ncbi:MAG: serine/threonine protein kinase [Planctomycetes bacterium]|nr:serine/threonine protein kinase [Planctomycetota bacterium]
MSQTRPKLPATFVPHHGPLPKCYEVGGVYTHGGMGVLLDVIGPEGIPLLQKRIPHGRITDVVSDERFKLEILNTVGLSLKLRDFGGVPFVYAWNDGIGDSYLLMEKIDGPTLKEAISGWGDYSHSERLAKSLRITRSICKTLTVFHGEGKVHRDITPNNILLRPGDNEPVLIDFGLSKHVQFPLGDLKNTQTGDRLGTPRYKPPELEIAGGDFSPSGDLFALGLIFFEMLTGGAARTGETIESVRAQVLLEDPPDVRKFASWVPAPVAKMAAVLLARNPKDRYSSAESLIADIDLLLTDAEATLSLHERPIARARRAWMRRSAETRVRGLRRLLGGIALAGLTIGAWVGLPKMWAQQASQSTLRADCAPLLERAAAWRETGDLLTQKSFSEAAMFNFSEARESLMSMASSKDYGKTGKALLAWYERAASPTIELNVDWHRPEKDMYGLAWVMPALDASISRHPDDAWLLAWRAWVELSFYDNLKAQADLAAARSLAPKAGLIRRFEFLARLGFGFSDRIWTYVEKNEDECPDTELGEWALWRAVLHRRDGDLDAATRELSRAHGLMASDDLLLPRVFAEMQLCQAKGGTAQSNSPHPDWAATLGQSNDPLAQFHYAAAIHLLGKPQAADTLPSGLSLEMHHDALLNKWAGLMTQITPKIVLPKEAGLKADFTNWVTVLRDFTFSGDSKLVEMDGDGVLRLLQAQGDLTRASRTSPRFMSKVNPFPETADWVFQAKLRWSKKGDYGSGIKLGGLAIFHDIAFRLHLPDGQTHLESTPGWHVYRIERRGDELQVFFDGAPVGPKIDAEQALVDQVAITTFGPTVSGVFEIGDIVVLRE